MTEHLEDQVERLRREQAEDASTAHTMRRHYEHLLQQESFKFFLTEVAKMLSQTEADALYGQELMVPREVKRGECIGIDRMLKLVPTSLNWAEAVLSKDDEGTEDDD